MEATGPTTTPVRASASAPDVRALSPQQLLAAAEKGREETIVDVPGLGPVLIGEISGTERADILSHQVELARKDRVDVKGYQRKLLLSSMLDPTSPEGERTPAFTSNAEASTFMQLGGGKIRHLVDEIERFSGMQVATTDDGRKENIEEGKDDSSSIPSD